jgi:ABC-type transport system substrate-binding protein
LAEEKRAVESSYWSRISRRRALQRAGALGLGVAGLALAGCSGSGKGNNAGSGSGSSTGAGGGSSPAAGGAQSAGTAPLPRLTPRSGPTVDEAKVNKNGVLHQRQAAIFASIHPYKGLDSGLLWGFTIFDHLFYTPTDTGVRELFLAQSVEQPDPLNLTFKLKQAVFHDKPPVSGRQVKASDVKASYDAAAKAPQISGAAWLVTVLDGITVPDDQTISFKLKQPDAWTYYSGQLGSPITGSIIPQEMLASPDAMDKDLIGSGHFQFVSHENGANFKLKRFDKWRVAGAPWLAGIEYKLLQEQAAADAAFAAQQIDTLLLANKPEKDQIVQQLGKGIEVDSQLGSNVWMIVGRGDAAWADPRTRQAIYLGINRDDYIDLMSFGDGKKVGIVPPVFGPYALGDQELASTYWKFDPAAGKQLLAASGLDLNHEWELKYVVPGDNNAQFAQITQSQLQKNLGLKIKLIGEDLGTWLQKSVFQTQYDGFITYQSLAMESPNDYIGVYQKGGSRPNTAHFFDDDMDKLYLGQKQILDDQQRIEAVKNIQRKGYEKAAPFIPVFSPIQNTANWAYVKGRVVGRGSFGLFNDFGYIDKS